MNRLAQEVSPYLRQHAHNPVDWYPWGEEALSRAAAEDKPILLSIGYSACHWCHVMERESFDDPSTATLMNELFVCIKVDREERPDLDHVYQLVVQLMGRSGGWPLTAFLTPDQLPFYGGTYFPPVSKFGMPAFSDVLRAVADAYRSRREEVKAQAVDITNAIAGVADQGGRTRTMSLGPELLQNVAAKLGEAFDDEHGGFGARPKFPSTLALALLLRRGALEGDDVSLKRACHALDAMQNGGIRDHLGGGFHRYSTDEHWLVPHFEKMLYDNALLLRLYTDAYRVTANESYRETARGIIDYVLREMVSPEQGFYTAQDADSEGEEGRFFVWTPDQVRAALAGDDEATRVAMIHFGITPEGNFENTDATVLSVVHSLEETAQATGMSVGQVGAALERAKLGLFAARSRRVAPFRDEKIVTSWNALLIGALADASLALGEPRALIAAERAFSFLAARLFRSEPTELRLYRMACDDVVKGSAFLEDYAFVADAALDLYEATGNPQYVDRAGALADVMRRRFWDEKVGGFFQAPDDGEVLIVRAKDPFDNAIPSGASVACRVFLRLGSIQDPRWDLIAETEVERLASAAVSNPLAFGQTLANMDRLVRGSVDVVVVGTSDDPMTRTLIETAFRAYLPNRTVAWIDPGEPSTRRVCAALAEGKSARAEAVAYVCRGRSCAPPASSPESLADLLRGTVQQNAA